MSNFPNYSFSKLTQAFCKCHCKTHNNEQIYIELMNIKRRKINWIEMYYVHIQKLVHGLQTQP
jgi:hypothetical protein